MVGVYALQSKKSRFSQYSVEETCPFCRVGPGDLSHMLLRSHVLTDIKEVQLTQIGDFVTRGYSCRMKSSWAKCELVAVLVDSHHLENVVAVRVDSDVLQQLAAFRRRYCYRLHVKKKYVAAPQKIADKRFPVFPVFLFWKFCPSQCGRQQNVSNMSVHSVIRRFLDYRDTVNKFSGHRTGCTNVLVGFYGSRTEQITSQSSWI